jgi:hypothetical protein
MKNLFRSIAVIGILFFSGCNSHKKSNEVASYKYKEKKVEMSDELRSKVPNWVTKDKVCYGLIIQQGKDENNNIVRRFGKAIKAKVIQINEDAIIMKALETVSLVKNEYCTFKRLTRGDVWKEKEGDLFLTREDAINSLKKRNLYKN